MKCSWRKIDKLVDVIVSHVKNKEYDLIISLNRGGIIPGVLLSHRLKIKHGVITIQSYSGKKRTKDCIIDRYISMLGDINPNHRLLIVDDIADSGRTLEELLKFLDMIKVPRKNIETATLYYKERSVFRPTYYGKKINNDTWVEFAWERD